MSSFLLKIIACIFMFIDHIGQVYYNGTSILNILGRLAFPIFAFQITEGYRHTKDVKKYLLRLFILALISQIPFMIMMKREGFAINTIATLLFGLICITIYDRKKIIGIISVIVLGLIAQFAKFDGGIYGVLLIFNFYIFKNYKGLLTFFYILIITFLYGQPIMKYINYEPEVLRRVFMFYLPYYLATLSPLILIHFYNNKKGKDIKYFFYLFYPLHIIIILLIKHFI